MQRRADGLLDCSHDHDDRSEKSLDDETRDQFEVRQTTFGRVAYHRGYKSESVLKLTDCPAEIMSLHDAGWDVSPGKTRWVLRAPEVAVCDLSNPMRNPVRDPESVRQFYETVRELEAEELLQEVAPSGLETEPLGGSCLECIEKVSGSDERITTVPGRLYDRLAAEGRVPKREDVEFQGWDLWETPVTELSESTRRRWETIASFYERVTNVEIGDTALGGVWSQLPEADVTVFVPKGGIKYFLGYLEETGRDDAMLWEYHRGINPTKEVRFGDVDFDGKTVNVVDKSYTGGTIEELSERIREAGGTPRRVSVFPKSRTAIQRSDYVVFGDDVRRTDRIDPTEDGWGLRLFEEVAGDVV